MNKEGVRCENWLASYVGLHFVEMQVNHQSFDPEKEMKKLIELTVLAMAGLFGYGIFSGPALADQKSEKESRKAENIEKVSAPDEMAEIFKHYFAIRDLLAHDKTDEVATEAKEMSQRLDKLIQALQAIRTASDSLRAEDLKGAREEFGLLSEAVLDYIEKFGFSGQAYSFRCDMAREGWLQEDDQIGNPYYGSEMYKCGKITGIIENGRYLEKK
jgi:hypothetical protein